MPAGEVNQRSCTDARCTKCTDNFLQQGQCALLTGTSQSCIGTCSADGSKYTLSIYNGKSCAGRVVKTNPMPTDQCLNKNGGGYLENICGPPPVPTVAPTPVPPTPPPPTGPPAPPGSDGLSAINAYRAANGLPALAECTAGPQAKAQAICDYDAANGMSTYVAKNGRDGVCDADSLTMQFCESNGYNGGDGGATWENAIKAMETSYTQSLLNKGHKCAAFGRCENCSKSKSGKPRNFYVVTLC